MIPEILATSWSRIQPEHGMGDAGELARHPELTLGVVSVGACIVKPKQLCRERAFRVTRLSGECDAATFQVYREHPHVLLLCETPDAFDRLLQNTGPLSFQFLPGDALRQLDEIDRTAGSTPHRPARPKIDC